MKDCLRVSTAELNIEELKQLRARCLAAVSLHRMEWIGTTLVGELLSLTKQFAENAGTNPQPHGVGDPHHRCTVHSSAAFCLHSIVFIPMPLFVFAFHPGF